MLSHILVLYSCSCLGNISWYGKAAFHLWMDTGLFSPSGYFNSTSMNNGVQVFERLLSIPGIYPGVELLSHTVILYGLPS